MTTSFEKQWEVSARLAKREGEFLVNFLVNHPKFNIRQIHDSYLFKSLEDYQLFTSEREKFFSTGDDANAALS